MGHSSLLGVERAAGEAPGRDTGALGPSDTSDSGSDMVGIDDLDINDPAAPVDAALDDDIERPLTPGDVLGGSSSDAAGTGERRAAGGDPGSREAADISVDRIFTPGAGDDAEVEDDDDEDPALAFVDDAAAEDVLSDEFPDDDATHPPGHPNPEPDGPAPTDPDDDAAPLDEDEGEGESQKPGRA